jgi:hypothetical protein
MLHCSSSCDLASLKAGRYKPWLPIKGTRLTGGLDKSCRYL